MSTKAHTHCLTGPPLKTPSRPHTTPSKTLERRWLPLGLLLLAAALVLTGCPGGKPGDKGQEQEADAGEVVEDAVPVEVAKATTGNITQTILSTATVTARHEVRVLAESTGAARIVEVEEGDQVTRGQLLARLSNPELELTIPTAASNVSRLRREVNTLKPLMDKGYVSRQSYEEMRYQLTQAQDQLKRARTQVAALRVASPISGIVAGRTVVPGQQVTPGQELFYVVDPDQLEVVVNIPERELGRIKEGDPAYVRSEALGTGLKFEGKIRLINPVVNPQTGTIKVTIALEALTKEGQTGTRLRPGMFVSVFMVTAQRQNATLIPKRAIIYKDDTPQVVLAKDNGDKTVALMRTIKVGYSEEDSVEVISGLEPGDQIVILGQAGLKDGAEIRVVQ